MKFLIIDFKVIVVLLYLFKYLSILFLFDISKNKKIKVNRKIENFKYVIFFCFLKEIVVNIL